MEIKIFVSLSACPCCSDCNEEAIRCAAFVDKLRKKYGESAKIIVLPAVSEEFVKLKNSSRGGAKLKAPVVVVDGRIVSAGKYPHNV